MFFFFNVPATTEIYTLSLHDALPILKMLSQCVATEWCAKVKRNQAVRKWLVGGGSRKKGVGFDFDRFKWRDRKSTRLNSSHVSISYAVFCLKKKTGPEDCRTPLHSYQ